MSQLQNWTRHPSNANYVTKQLNGEAALVRIKPDARGKGYLWQWGKVYGYGETIDEAKTYAIVTAQGILG